MSQSTGSRIAVILMQLGVILFCIAVGKNYIMPPPEICPEISFVFDGERTENPKKGDANFCNKTIDLKGSYRPKIVHTNDIVYVDLQRNYVRIYLNNNKTVISYETPESFELKLINCKEFFKGKSYLFNCGYINEIIQRGEQHILALHKGKILPPSGRVKKQIKKLKNALKYCT